MKTFVCQVYRGLQVLGLAVAIHHGWGAAPLPVVPQIPPLPPSPVQQFRAWLAMGPEERRSAIAEWPAEKRKVLWEKLGAYDAFSPEERERRLQMVEVVRQVQQLIL